MKLLRKPSGKLKILMRHNVGCIIHRDVRDLVDYKLMMLGGINRPRMVMRMVVGL